MREKRDEEHTNATLPIHYDVVLVSQGREKDGEEFGAFFSSTSPWHAVSSHGLIADINEAVEPTISFKTVTHVFELRGADIKNRLITNERFDEEFASLTKFQTLDLGILNFKEEG